MAKKLTQIIDNHFELKKGNIIYISGDYTKFHVNKYFGNVLSTYDETGTLREDWNYYNAIHGEDFIRLLDAFLMDYSPIENYDRYEDTTIKFDKGAQTDQIISAPKTAHTENKVSAFDTEGYSNSSKIDNTQDGFTDSSVNGSREDNTITSSHIRGNIGIVSAMDLLEKEARIRYNELINKYIDRWVQSVIVGYDEGYVDTTPSYDEYATKAELNAVKNDVNDLEDSVDSITSSVNTLGQTVSAATADITTLYSQTDSLRTDLNGVDDIVQSTVADVEELQTEVENLDTRVTALENAPAPSAQEVYSSTEIEVGTWIDGKKIYRKVWPVMVETSFPAQTWMKIPNINIGSAFILKITLSYIANDVNGNFIPVSAYKNPDGSIFIMHYRNTSQELHANKHFYIVDYIKQ